jgi:hypothetical protein
MQLIRFLFTAFIILLAACQQTTVSPSQTAGIESQAILTVEPTPADPGILVPRTTPDFSQLPLLEAHMKRVQEVLQQPVPILPLIDELDEEQQAAQEIALADERIQHYARNPQTQAAFRNEVFGVYPMRASDVTQHTSACVVDTCYRVEIYNYALNFYLSAAVDLQAEAVIDIVGYDNTQPDIPASLTEIAIEIATHSPEVIQTLGYTPDTSEALMPNTKTALNTTVCERSRHLCVAPTFVTDERALWAIVDLTDGRLVGTRWTEVGSTMPITEKQLADDYIMRTYCQRYTAFDRDGWLLDYMLTSSDGLLISDVSFRGETIFDSVKLVDWHVNYSSADGFGYSDAVGCPVFSQAAVIAIGAPRVDDIVEGEEVVGFALIQEFWSELWPLPCNYFYEQRYEFYKDGRFRPVVTNIGRGCGNDGTYRPVTRIALANSSSTFSQWNGSEWEDWLTEDWTLAANVPASEDGYQFRLTNPQSTYYVVPSTGQFGDGGRGDDAYIYVTLHHADRDEGDSDMPTIGPCCNTDYQQGPEKFIDPTPESITDASLVLWYVAQLDNDDTPGAEYCWADSVLENGIYVARKYPCPSGPMFVPANLVDATATDG